MASNGFLVVCSKDADLVVCLRGLQPSSSLPTKLSHALPRCAMLSVLEALPSFAGETDRFVNML